MKLSSPDKSIFNTVVQDRAITEERTPLDFEDIFSSKDSEILVEKTKAYVERLGVNKKSSPIFFANGVVFDRDERWIQYIILRVSEDLREIQEKVFEDIITDESWIPEYYLANAIRRQNPIVIPEDESTVKLLHLNDLYSKHKDIFNSLLHIPAATDSSVENWASLVLVHDFDTDIGARQLIHAIDLRERHSGVEIFVLHYPSSDSAESSTISTTSRSTMLYGLSKSSSKIDIKALRTSLEPGDPNAHPPADSDSESAALHWQKAKSLAKELLNDGESGMLLNGRLVGPMAQTDILGIDDLEQLLSFEFSKRIKPVTDAAVSLGLAKKFNEPLTLAKLTSLVDRSTESDIPEGIFDNGPNVRTNKFEAWSNKSSAITVSNKEDPSIYIVASVDPTSETAQRWIPILKVLSELSGVHLKLHLSPRQWLRELPIKRYYRHVLGSEPLFDSHGSLIKPQASFQGVPAEALLNLGMDVPPSWLVAPKESVHDLDNLKLSSLKDGSNVEALYELQHILIEGHSRDITTGVPSRGVQLLLGTEENPHFSDTIVMANLGYFQFKAQPGLWKITLKPGRSKDIFNLDSAGSDGSNELVSDGENDKVALLSFQGNTLFPRLSRKPGWEEEDVLDDSFSGSAKDYLSKGLNFASGVLSSMTGTAKEQHADINIFSVASGHLYERMLNIMMVSVMRHTKHSVKFWFIEQFLSPSFKSFLPHLAKEYGFSYEMVTFKWPHWLRAQSEKQREIWGYKILFLDVLFPLSLDKVIFVDADQIVRTDMYDLVKLDLEGAPYGFTPMCDSRTSMEGFRFWKQGYWKTFLRGLPYHISALYVVDLNRFRQLAAGDRLRGQYHALSADKNSLSNLDQDLPNHMQHNIPIKSLPQEWLWCETWCSDEALSTARTIDLCNNPQTKEPKLDRARRQVPEWTVYDEEIAGLAQRVSEESGSGTEDDAEKEDVEKEDRKEEL